MPVASTRPDQNPKPKGSGQLRPRQYIFSWLPVWDRTHQIKPHAAWSRRFEQHPRWGFFSGRRTQVRKWLAGWPQLPNGLFCLSFQNHGQKRLGLPKIEVEEPLSPRVGVMRRIRGAGAGRAHFLRYASNYQKLSNCLSLSRRLYGFTILHILSLSSR